MSRLLKKLTHRLVRVFGTLLPLVLAAPAMAQWGAVTSQPDTNRFINSQQDFGLIMPHQQVIVGLLDTTVSSVGIRGGNASKVIVGSLLDHEDNCANYTIVNGVASCAGSYERWRELEKSTSWYQAARGDTTAMFPTNYAVTITTGQDSVVIWNRDTAELWMAFKGAANSVVAATNVNGIEFLDGRLYFVQTTGTRLGIADFLEDDIPSFDESGSNLYKGNIQSRNSALGPLAYDSRAIANSSVNGVAAVRDPFGLKDALGRPKHWWAVTTTGKYSVYNPHANAIYDAANASASGPIAMDSRGSFTVSYTGLNPDYLALNNSIFKATADSWISNSWDSLWHSDAVEGGADLAISDFSSLDIVAGNAITGRNAPIVIAGGSSGLYRLTSSMRVSNTSDPSGSNDYSRQRFSATVNAPVEFGDAVLALALEDNTTDSSPYGNTMTANNSPGTIAAVFGNGYSSKGASSSLTKSGATGLDGGTASFWGSLWVYPTENTNGRVLTFNGDSNTDRLYISVNVAANSIQFIYTDDGYSTLENATWSGTIRQDRWTHIAFTRDSEAILNVLWVDGIRAATDVALNEVSASLNWDDIGIGDDVNGGGQHFYGRIDDLAYGQDHALTDEVVARIHAEGRKKLAMGTPVFANATDDALLSNNVVDIDALDNGMWAVAFSDANTVQVFDGRVPVQQIAAPAGTVKSIALIQSPGTDSVGVAIGTTTNLKFVQPSINLRAAMAHRYQEPIHVGESVVVDSAGIGGIFWTGDDAIDAGANANHRRIFVMDGTYGSLNLDQSRMYVECESTEAIFNGKVANHGIYVTAPRSVIDGCGALTTAGGGSAYDGIHVAATGDSTKIIGVHISDSDDLGISWISGANVGWIFDSTVDGADDHCVYPGGLQIIVSGNQVRGCGGQGISVDTGGDIHIINNHLRGIATESINISNSNGDNNIIVGNRTVDGTYGVRIASGANNNVIVGNRLSGASVSNLTNSGTGNTVADNNTN